MELEELAESTPGCEFCPAPPETGESEPGWVDAYEV
jgi:hypothetical protein